MSDKKQQVIDLHNEQRQTVGKCRLALAKALDDLEEFGGDDEYKPSVSIIASGYGDEGVLMMRLRELLPNSKELNEAIQELKGEVVEVDKGRKTRLKSLNKPQPPEAQPPVQQPVVPPSNPPVVSTETSRVAQPAVAVAQG